MDPLDRPDLVDGADCAACGRTVPPETTRLLAQREDLAFVELGCVACGSVSLAIRLGGTGVARSAGVTANGAARGRSIGSDDVIDMHVFLAGYRGDLRGLLGRPADSGRPDATGAA